MARTSRSRLIKNIASQWAEDAMWGIPESPEFSSVQRLMIEFQAHAEHEHRWLAEYRDNAKEASDPLVRFLLEMIVADEERHHELTVRMISKLKDELAWTRSQGLTRRVYESGAKGKRLLSSIDNFLGAERKGIADYERFKQKSQGQYRDVFALLYTTMIQDSHKHIAILEFLRKILAESQRDKQKRKVR